MSAKRLETYHFYSIAGGQHPRGARNRGSRMTHLIDEEREAQQAIVRREANRARVVAVRCAPCARLTRSCLAAGAVSCSAYVDCYVQRRGAAQTVAAWERRRRRRKHRCRRAAESIANGGSARGSDSAASWVRVFFNLTADDHAVCLLAPDATYIGMTAHNNQISRTGATPNLVRHPKGVFHEKSMKKYNELVAAGKAPEHAAADTIARARAAEEASAVTHFMKKAKKYNAPDTGR